ncbi:MAG: BMC domain-containing protein [Clostridiales bacterium]|jgi:ethanolamine utilization protein EutS|nr:BMC domain-containing protein [Clostridiales bacterium]
METEKIRTIQEYVPGKQVTMAHLIANPVSDLCKKLGLNAENIANAIGIMTITPSEASIVAADAATKAGGVNIGFVDRFSGTLLIYGDIASVEAALQGAMDLLGRKMGFTLMEMTRS